MTVLRRKGAGLPQHSAPSGESRAARLAALLGRIEARRAREAGRARTERVEAVVDAGGESSATEAEKLRSERDEYLDLARRERAELENYRKRVARDMQNLKRESLAAFLKEFFAPLDDLDRIVGEAAKSHSYESLQTGVRILEENLWKALAKAGVKKINAMGKPFNPEFHEAMAATPSSDVAPNTVIEVYDNGYKLDDFVLRPARVVVSREP